MYSNPPGRRTSAIPWTNTGRSSSLKVWNRPQSITVSNCLPSEFNSRAFPTMKLALIPRSTALAFARSMATGTKSRPQQ